MTAFAHSGRTDSDGGHRDNKNKSGLGSYHYHCGGHPAHLHENGVCPYAPKDKITISNYNATMNIGDNQTFEYEIESDNSYVSPSITSSDDSVISVDGTNLKAKGVGTATITIETSTATETFTVEVKEVCADKIELSVIASELQVGGAVTIDTTVYPENASDKSVTYCSSDENIATVSDNGEIKGIAPGTVTITATTSNDISESIDITVLENVPTEIKCEDSVELKIGSTYDFEVEIFPEDAGNKEYTITSDNEEIVKYSNGSLQALKEGTTTLHIETWNGVKKDVPVQIDIIPVEKVTIVDSTNYRSSNTIDISDEIVLSAEIMPDNATHQEVTWSSSDPNIVSIVDGKFQVKGKGNVTITCSAYGDVTSSIDIVVQDPSDENNTVIVVGIAIVCFVIFFRRKKRRRR